MIIDLDISDEVNNRIFAIIDAFPKRKVKIKNIGRNRSILIRNVFVISSISMTAILLVMLYFIPEFVEILNQRWIITRNPVEAHNAVIVSVYNDYRDKLYDRIYDDNLSKIYTSKKIKQKSFYSVDYYYFADGNQYKGDSSIEGKDIVSLTEDDLKVYFAPDRPDISTLGYSLKQNQLFASIALILSYISAIVFFIIIWKGMHLFYLQAKLSKYIGKNIILRPVIVEITKYRKTIIEGKSYCAYKGLYNNNVFHGYTNLTAWVKPKSQNWIFNKEDSSFYKTESTVRFPLPFYIRNIQHESKKLALAIYIKDGVMPLLLDDKLERLDLTSKERKRIILIRNRNSFLENLAHKK